MTSWNVLYDRLTSSNDIPSSNLNRFKIYNVVLPK